MTATLDELQALLTERRRSPVPGSYTNSLLGAGEDEIVKKLGEEAIEVILAAKSQGNERLIEEAADLVYHLLVLLISRELSWSDVEAELRRRQRPDAKHEDAP